MKLAVIGYPIKHSKSPYMHNFWLDQAGVDGEYEAIEVPPEHLENNVYELIKSGFTGFNVTIPHKESIIQYLDEVDAAAKSLGAVNTVLINDGKSYGYNTDGNGFLKSLLTKRDTEEIKKANMLIIGAGGAAKGMIGALKSFGCDRISVTNRTIEKADLLIKDHRVNGQALQLSDAEQRLNEYDIVINTTSAGMFPKVQERPIDSAKMKHGSLAADIIYNPQKTSFLKQAEQAGAESLNGIGMFVYQGALAFEMWTGIQSDAAEMIKKMTELMNQE
ncbi:shikimate dehydrogenase [Jeotgalibacillus salarius]|uniref:Shikimate dehydrogenase (NADP(+)) n=1 Tax=Jeotgalibacillus salarius TaxID=546023 RepID=A0A4Y8LFG8_9BACL|nr:shikimate dehydrogenase [Jeotgalibacillus salarius]TFE01083.1 shikimate dehydrogenase [Jeotgalibacillus salarius]